MAFNELTLPLPGPLMRGYIHILHEMTLVLTKHYESSLRGRKTRRTIQGVTGSMLNG